MKKTLFVILASCGLVIPSLQAAEYTQSFSGNVRVESTSVEEDFDTGAVETLSTSFGGEDEESSTGGDTHLQWDHHFVSDDGNTEGSGFIRFKGDGRVRYNVEATSQLGDYEAALKAEWESIDGFGGDLVGRDQFATLTHTPSGVYYKIGREEWLNNEKGYVSDFLSYTELYTRLRSDARFSLHALGWRGAGFHAALLIQRDVADGTAAAGSLFGDGGDDGLGTADRTSDTEGFGVRLGYAAGPVDAELTFLSGDQDTRAGDGGLAEVSGSGDVTQLYLAFPIQDGAYQPFFNYAAQEVETSTAGANDRATYDRTGWNLGIAFGFGSSDLILAYGTLSEETVASPTSGTSEEDTNGFDVIWSTSQDPLTVALAYSTQSREVNNGASLDDTQYGVRLEYGF